MERRSWLRLLVAFAAIEIVGIAVGVAGLTAEIIYRADLWQTIITAGMIIFAAGSGLWAKVYVGGNRDA